MTRTAHRPRRRSATPGPSGQLLKEPTTVKIAHDVLDALAQATTDGSALRLSGRIDPNLYTRCDKVLRAACGQWSRRAQSHLFPEDPAPRLKQVLATGQLTVPQDVGYFPTPLPVVRRLIERAPPSRPRSPRTVRRAWRDRPRSAAAGCLVDCVELLDDNVRALTESGTARTVTAGDFLGLDPEPAYDRVVMNTRPSPTISRTSPTHAPS